MKKILLLVLVVFVSLPMVAQQPAVLNTPELVSPQKHVKGKKVITDDAHMQTSADQKPTSTTINEKGNVVGESIGTSTYDLQTNNSICRRVNLHDDGSISAVWTYSNDFSLAAPDRGTGYNYYDAGTGMWGAAPTSRIEPDRVGWPNIVETADGRLVVVAHFAGAVDFFGGLSLLTKDPGEDWVHTAFPGNDEDTWARMAVSGNTVHVIVSRPRTDPAIFNGVPGGIAYYRSLDGGDTWEDAVAVTGMDTDNFVNFGGDSYAIDASGNTVAFVAGGFAPALFKSSDNGDTWTFERLEDMSNLLFNGELGETLDMMVATDESYSIIVDDSGQAHIWYGKVRIQDEDPNTEGWTYFPGENGIMYWNESMDSPEVIGATIRPDFTGDCLAEFDFNVSDDGLYFQAPVSMPTSGIDADGNLYMAYATFRDGDMDASSNIFYDVMMVKSMDGGATWIGPYNVTDDIGEESVYPHIARDVDTHVHLVYQADDLAGLAVQPDPGTHGFVTNNMQYIAIDVNDIVDQPDDTCPEVSLVGTFPEVTPFANCPLGADFFGVVAFDHPDGNITDLIETGGDVDWSTPGTYTLEFSVTDSDGNVSEIVEITVPVNPDDEAPVITLNGTDNIDVLMGEAFDDPGAMVTDNSDVVNCGAAASLTVSGSVDVNTVGSYQLTYNANDASGNEADAVTRTVNVIGEDTEAPTITLMADPYSCENDNMDCTIPAEQSGVWTEPGFEAFDNLAPYVLTSEVIVSGDTPDLEVPGDYTINYEVTDASGLTTMVTRNVSIADLDAPIINVSPGTILLSCGDVFSFPTVTAFDNFDTEVNGDDVTNDAADVLCTDVAGNYQITYSATDASGNVGTTIGTVIVIDNGACSDPPCTTGIEDITLDNGISVLPNPTNGELSVKFSNIDAEDATVQVYDILGKQILNAVNTSTVGQINLDLSNQTNGVYFIQINTELGTATKRVVLNK